MEEDEEQANETRQARYEGELRSISSGRPENAELLAKLGALRSTRLIRNGQKKRQEVGRTEWEILGKPSRSLRRRSGRSLDLYRAFD